MTIEEFILSRSYLPKNGTYTMEDHIKAMLMTLIGSCSSVLVSDIEQIKTEVKDSTSSANISITTDDKVVVLTDIVDSTIVYASEEPNVVSLTEQSIIPIIVENSLEVSLYDKL